MTVYQLQGIIILVYGLSCLLMVYHVGKLEERLARLEYELSQVQLKNINSITKTVYK